MKNKFLICLILVVTLLLPSLTCFANYDAIQVYLDGKLLKFDVQPTVINGRTMVPMRTIFEELGASVFWDGATEKITGIKDDIVIVMQLNNKNMKVNDKNVVLDVAPFETGGRTLVPARAVAESFGVYVEWSDVTQTVYITTEKQDESAFNIDFSDYAHGSINNPFLHGMEFGKYAEFDTIAYQANPEDEVKQIRLYSNKEMVSGKEAETFAKELLGKENAVCASTDGWRVYNIKIEYVSGKEPLVLGEIFCEENLYQLTGHLYKPERMYFYLGQAYEEGSTKKTLAPGLSASVRLFVLSGKNPRSPLLCVKFNGGKNAWWYNLDTMFTETPKKPGEEVELSSGISAFSLHDAPDFSYVSQLLPKKVNESYDGIEYIYEYNQTKIDEYYAIMDRYGWNLLFTEHDTTKSCVTHRFTKNGVMMICIADFTGQEFRIIFN